MLKTMEIQSADHFLERPLAAAGSSARSERARDLVHAHFDFVWRVLRRLGVAPSEVDDAAQQVFWVAVRKIAPQPGATDEAFLMAVAVRVASEFRRRARNRREIPGADPIELPDSAQSPEEQLHLRRALAIADQILDTMPWDLRVAFVLFEIEDKTTPEIAEILGVPLGTAASRLRRAREAFSRAVAARRADHGSGRGRR